MGNNTSPNQDPDIHLKRLLAETDRSWWQSIRDSIVEATEFKKLPPLQTTSKPVAVRDI